MSHKQEHTALEKEFELERVILFSDAVFAIAITLLVIDIKFPELPENLSGVHLLKLFRPTILGFIAFAVSFLFIGKSWSNHLRLFRLLKKYDQGLINRNLIFLFFIVIFPFAASGVSGHMREKFFFPLFLYFFNLACATVSYVVLCHYILYGKGRLVAEGEAVEKKYLYMRSLFSAASILTMALVITVALLLFPGNADYFLYSCMIGVILMAFINKKAKKYRPPA